MTKMTAVRLDELLLQRIDHERRGAGLSRARVIHDALALWLERWTLDQAIRADHDGYEKRPVRADEFGPVLGAQTWPK